MCFYADYDWYSEINEEGEVIAISDIKCDECCRTIAKGEKAHHIYQQEYEVCPSCMGLSGDEDDEDVCPDCDGDPDGNIGNTYDWDCCEQCWKFLESIEALEIERGCHRSEARPPLGDLYEYMGNDRDEAREYAKFAVARYPEIREHIAEWLKAEDGN